MYRKTLEPIPANHQRAIVPGRSGIEEAIEEFFADHRIEKDPTLQMTLQGFATRQHHQGSSPRFGQLIQASDQHGQTAAFRAGSPAIQSQRGDLLEKSPQVVLEDDYQQDHQHCGKALEDPGGQLQFELPGDQIEDAEESQAEQRHPRVHAAGPGYQAPEQ